VSTAPSRSGLSVDRDALAWILDELALESNQPVERSQLRRIVDDVVSAWPGPADERWMVWAAEAGHSLGRPARIVDCTAKEIVELARQGVTVISRPRGEHSWVAVVGGGATSKVLVLQPFGEPNRESVKPRAAARRLRGGGAGPTTRFVVLDPPRPVATEPYQHGHEHLSPLSRFWKLLKPESLDMLTITAFSVVTGVLAMATPLAVESLVSTVAFGRLLQPVFILAVLLFGFLAFSAAVKALQTLVTEIIQRRLFARVAADIAFRLPRARVDAMEHEYAPELVNRFFEVVTVQKVASQLILDGVALVITTFIGMGVLALYHPWLLGFDIVLLAMVVFAVFVLGRGAVATSISESRAKYRTAAWLEDIAACPTTFRYDGAAEFALERADRHIYEYLEARKAHFRVLIRQVLFVLALQAVANTALLGLGGWLVISGQLTLGQLVAAELIVAVVVGSFTKAGKHLESFYDVMASMDKLGHLFDVPVERQDGQVFLPGSDTIEVQFSHASYHYHNGREGLLPLNWRIEAGSRWALMGPDGSGKTTVLDLVYGMREPSHGAITINGVAPRELRPDALRRHVALCRNVEIFGGTIAENVHLMRPEITLADVHEALETVGLLDAVLDLPATLDTLLVTGDGRPLTGGQLHRLMLARAIVGRPGLLLIDGALDVLPDEEAVELTDRLCVASRTWTLVIVTGRNAIAERMPKRQILQKPAESQRILHLEGSHGH
jgi:putative ABC transport system ATP-binding protein